jgi:hypothetical protein
MRQARNARGWGWTIAAGAAVVLAGAVALSAPLWNGRLLGCNFRRLSGWNCPGCGGTRATLALLDGDLLRALRMNPLVVVLAGVALVLGLRAVWRERRGVVPAFPDISRRWGVAIVLTVVAFALLRNLAWWPFAWMAAG